MANEWSAHTHTTILEGTNNTGHTWYKYETKTDKKQLGFRSNFNVKKQNTAQILHICTVPSDLSTLTGLLPKVTVFLAMARLEARKCYAT